MDRKVDKTIQHKTNERLWGTGDVNGEIVSS